MGSRHGCHGHTRLALRQPLRHERNADTVSAGMVGLHGQSPLDLKAACSPTVPSRMFFGTEGLRRPVEKDSWSLQTPSRCCWVASCLNNASQHEGGRLLGPGIGCPESASSRVKLGGRPIPSLSIPCSLSVKCASNMRMPCPGEQGK